MKKTLLAITATALFASGAANAVKLYDNDGTTFEFTGSMRIMFEYSDSRPEGDHDVKLVDQGSRFGVKINHQLDSEGKLFGYGVLEYGNDTQSSEDDFDLTNRLGHIGLKLNGVGDIAFGRVLSPFDDLELSDYTAEYGGVLDFGNGVPKHHNNNFIGRVSNTVRVMSAEFNGFSIGATYTLQDESTSEYNTSKSRADFSVNEGYTVTAFYDTGFGLRVNAGYGHANYNEFAEGTVLPASAGYEIGDKVDASIWGISAEYQYEKLSVSLTYGQSEVGVSPVAAADYKKKANLYGVGANYEFDLGGKSTSNLYGGFYVKDGRENVTYNHYVTTVGADYRFKKNYRIWLEYGNFRDRGFAGKISDDNRMALGFRVYF